MAELVKDVPWAVLGDGDGHVIEAIDGAWILLDAADYGRWSTSAAAETSRAPARNDLSSASLAQSPGSGGALVLSGRITDVVDGDTIKVESRGLETTVRLIGIDTPKTRQPSKPVQCYGLEASARAARLPGAR